MNKVMIVDDAAFMRASIKNMLVKNNFEVVGEAENGKVAVDLMAKLKPDIITLDITMPEMSGIEALPKLREIDPNCKIIIISAMGQEGYVKEAIMQGAKYFIVKPFKEMDLVLNLRKIMT